MNKYDLDPITMFVRCLIILNLAVVLYLHFGTPFLVNLGWLLFGGAFTLVVLLLLGAKK
jgi:hypothetical protein